ncbi:MAG: regulatory iron-sulfur-containing complex subunit RicT [bacterium]|nr:regulatory iron-sulfur-containing complex subunit RicT [bacterium]
MNSYAVSYKDSNKSYFFKSSEKYEINDEVIVDTDKGLQYGKIVKLVEVENLDNLKIILRKATKEDTDSFYTNLKDADIALKNARNIVNDLKLDMHIINASYNLERTQLLFNFYADERIDFRNLAKKLASIYRTRIELRQIGARDKAKQVSGIGICGEQLCCSRFLKQFDSITMNMAKNQNIALNPNKINGSCGRLLCCLNYEDEEYTTCSKNLLSIGTIIKYNGEDATIIGVDILNRKYKILCGDQKILIDSKQVENDSEK